MVTVMELIVLVGNRSFVFTRSFRGIFSISLVGLVLSSGCGPDDTTNGVRHGSTSIGAQNFDGNNIRLLGDTVLGRSDGT